MKLLLRVTELNKPYILLCQLPGWFIAVLACQWVLRSSCMVRVPCVPALMSANIHLSTASDTHISALLHICCRMAEFTVYYQGS